ncbi:MAG: hypothetical protein P8Y53_07930, partial [Pseudolabrys sp.]
DQHQADGLWFLADPNGRIEPVDGLIYDIECADTALESPALTLETAAGQANYPCTVAYAGKSNDFFCYRSDTNAEWLDADALRAVLKEQGLLPSVAADRAAE